MVDPHPHWPACDHIPTSVGHDACSLMLLAAARRRLSPELETALADPGTLVGSGGGAPRGNESPPKQTLAKQT